MSRPFTAGVTCGNFVPRIILEVHRSLIQDEIQTLGPSCVQNVVMTESLLVVSYVFHVR